MQINVEEMKRLMRQSGLKKEQVIAAVQDKGYRFSLASLDRIYRGELPKNDLPEILEVIASKIECKVSDFYSEEAA